MASLEAQKQYLLEKGCSQEFLDKITDQKVLNYLYSKVYKNCEEDGLQLHIDKGDEVNSFYDKGRGTIPTERLKLYLKYMNYTNGNVVVATDVLIYYEWLLTPSARGTDGLVFSFDSSKYVIDPDNFMTWNFTTNMKTGAQNSFNYNFSISKYTNGSVGWYAELKDPSYIQTLQSNPGGSALVSMYPSYPLQYPVNAKIGLEYDHTSSDSGNVWFSAVVENIRSLL